VVEVLRDRAFSALGPAAKNRAGGAPAYFGEAYVVFVELDRTPLTLAFVS
jgi:hypothetical protein